ncbi:MAG: dehydrogenase subunit [Ignavibacteria bacterium]|nr:dehydrogenase subunit [Ignavibacteria bacterium]
MGHNTLLILATIVLLLPLASFLILVTNRKRLPGRSAGIIGTSFIGIGLILSIIIAAHKMVTFKMLPMIQYKFDWFTVGNIPVKVGIGIDNITGIMLIVVMLISFLVHLFSVEYMRDDVRFSRYFAYLGVFTFSMLGIVIANNFFFMYIFWELVGLSSYLLIGHWYEKDSASNAAKKAFITNRIGDLGFFIGIMILYFSYNSFMFDEIFTKINYGILPFDSGTMLTVAGILIFCGAIGKSAQFPLHVWLPDAMEGPTPVSALIHAATMVAAGVYMTARVFPMFTGWALIFIAYTGAITAFIAATIAITQNDFKRVLAYSTVSQLGYMIMGLGVGAFTNGFFHLVTHAWFKACLFLASGSVIFAMHKAAHHFNDHHTDAQDIRNMGGLRKTMPLTYYTFLMATIAICGVPFTSGFLSKDGILAGTLAYAQLNGHWLIPIIGFSAAGMTAFYMFRLAIVAFHGQPKTEIAGHTKENNWVIVFPLVLLATLSLWFFYSGNPLDPSKGWFHEKVKPQPTAVLGNLQWAFLIPYESKNPSHQKVLQRVYGIEPKDEMDMMDEMPLKPEAMGMPNPHMKPDAKSANQQALTDDEMMVNPHTGKKEMPNDEMMVNPHTGKKEMQNEEMMVNPHTQAMAPNSSTAKVDAHIPQHAEMGKEKAKNDEHKAKGEHGEAGAHHAFNKFEEQSHAAHIPAMIISLLCAGIGMLLSFSIYQFKFADPDKLALKAGPFYRLSFNKWYFDEIYNVTVIGGTMLFSKLLGLFDNKVVDGLVNLSAGITRVTSYFVGHFDNIVVDGLVNLSANVTGFSGNIIRKLQTGRVQSYVAFTITGIIILLYYFW